MNKNNWLPAFGMAALCGCAPHSKVPNGAVVLEQDVALMRFATADSAFREMTIADDAIVVAMADERLTDVRLGLSPRSSRVRGTSIRIAAI